MQKKVEKSSVDKESFPKVIRKRKPFRLLATMSKKEIETFSLFLVSPVTNPKPDQALVKFFNECKRLDIWETDMDKAMFLKKTGQNLTDNVFDKLVSRLYDQLQVYGSIMEFMMSRPQQVHFTIKYYKRKGLEFEELDKKVKEIKRDLAGINQLPSFFHLLLELDLETAEKAQSRSMSPDDRGLISLHSHLDNYFLILKLRFLCATANEARIFGNGELFSTTEVLIPWFRDKYTTMPVLARAYFHAYHILREIDESIHVQELLGQLRLWESMGLAVVDNEYAELNGYLLNYYLRKLNSDDLNLAQAHQFYVEKLGQGLLFDEGKLTHEHFKNLIALHCRMGMITDARSLFETYKNRLPDKLSTVAISYNEAILELHEKKYPSAINKLEALIDATGAIKDDKFYGLDIRCNTLKAYFEYLQVADLNDWDSTDQKLHSLLRAFVPFLQRKRDMWPISRVRFENFAKMLQRMYVIRFNPLSEEREKKREELLLDIRSSSNLPNKGWFVQQVIAF